MTDHQHTGAFSLKSFVFDFQDFMSEKLYAKLNIMNQILKRYSMPQMSECD